MSIGIPSFRRARKEMPVHNREVDAAEKEGVKLEMLAAPLELLSENGELTTIRYIGNRHTAICKRRSFFPEGKRSQHESIRAGIGLPEESQ